MKPGKVAELVRRLAGRPIRPDIDQRFAAAPKPGPPPGERERIDDLNRRAPKTALNPQDVDKDLIGRCLVCRRRWYRGPVCRFCFADPKRRALWEDPATGKKKLWFVDLERRRDQATKAHDRNQDRLDAGRFWPVYPRKRGRPPAWGVQEFEYRDDPGDYEDDQG
jgi:hypothetical protein